MDDRIINFFYKAPALYLSIIQRRCFKKTHKVLLLPTSHINNRYANAHLRKHINKSKKKFTKINQINHVKDKAIKERKPRCCISIDLLCYIHRLEIEFFITCLRDYINRISLQCEIGILGRYLREGID